MDDPLEPENMSDNKRNALVVTMALVAIFFTISVVLIFIYGIQNGAYLFLDISILALIATTILLGRWVKQGGIIEGGDQLGYIVGVQITSILVIFIALLVLVYAPYDDSGCPVCTGCTFTSSGAPDGCGTVTFPTADPSTCFKCPRCMGQYDSNSTVCVYYEAPATLNTFHVLPSSDKPMELSAEQFERVMKQFKNQEQIYN